MRDNYYAGFWYDNEVELKELLGLEAYLDMKYDKDSESWEAEDAKWPENDQKVYEKEKFNQGRYIYCFRKARALTQKQFARELGIGIETLSKIENNYPNLRKSIKLKINKYFGEVENTVIYEDVTYY